MVTIQKAKGLESIWLHHVATSSDTQIIAPADRQFLDPIFSPDGNFFYFRQAADPSGDVYDLMRAAALGGEPQRIGHDVDRGPAPSPDGKQLAYVRDNDPNVGQWQLLIANGDGSGERVVSTGALNKGNPASVTWAPNADVTVTFIGEAASTTLLGFDPASGKNVSTMKTPLTFLVTSGRHARRQRFRRCDDFPLHRIPPPAARVRRSAFGKSSRDHTRHRKLFLSHRGGRRRDDRGGYISRPHFDLSLPAHRPAETPVNPLFPELDSTGGAWAHDGGAYQVMGGDLIHFGLDGSRKTLASDPQATIGNVVPCYGTNYIIFTWAGHEQRQSIWRVNSTAATSHRSLPAKTMPRGLLTGRKIFHLPGSDQLQYFQDAS